VDIYYFYRMCVSLLVWMEVSSLFVFFVPPRTCPKSGIGLSDCSQEIVNLWLKELAGRKKW